MPIDPEAKKAQQAKRAEDSRLRQRERYARAKALKKGGLSPADKAIVAQVAEENPSPTPAQINALATVLQRKPTTIKRTIQEARERFQSYALEYVEAHRRTLNSDDPDVARKAAQWAIEHISTRDKDGNVERIVEAADSSDERPSIQIGINLGGIPSRGSQPTAIDGEVEIEEE